MAAHSAYVIWYLRGRDDKGELFLLSDGLGVGYGARPTADGNDAVYLVAQENFPSEFLDSVFPVRVLRYAINPDTGGPGRWRGGCGLIREIEVLAPEAMVSMRIDSVEHPPWGVAGGHAAGTGRCVVNPGRPGRAHPAAPERRQHRQAAATSCASRPAAAAAGAIPSTASPSACWPTCAAASSAGRAREEHYGVVLTGDGHRVDRGGHGRSAARGGRRPSSSTATATTRRSPDDRARNRQGRASSSASTRAAPSPTSPCSTRRRAASGPPRPRRRRTTPRAASATASPRCCRPPGLAGADVARVLHGTTVATNLILEGKGAPAALITTAGFKYVLEIGRQDVPRRASLFAWVKPKRPGAARAHLRGRRPHRPRRPRAAAARRGGGARGRAARSRQQGIGSIAVVLLHSYANPAHERRVAAILAEEMPDALVSLSSEVLPVFREYERSMTTILNASVMPVVSAYVERAGRARRRAGHRRAAAAHEVERRRHQHAHRAPRARRDGAVRPGGGRRRRGLRRRRLRAPEPDRHRHRRHLGRHLPDPRRRARPHHQRPHRRLAGRPAHDRHRDDRGGRRLHRPRLRTRAR